MSDSDIEVKLVSRDSPAFEQYAKMIVSQWGEHELEEVGLFNEGFDIRDPVIYMLMKGEDILGGMTLHEQEDSFFLTYLIIRDDLRGNGYGTMLLKHAEKVSIETRKNIELYAESWNEQSRKFYERNGYEYLWDENISHVDVVSRYCLVNEKNRASFDFWTSLYKTMHRNDMKDGVGNLDLESDPVHLDSAISDANL